MAVSISVTGTRQMQAQLKKLEADLKRVIAAEAEAAGKDYVKRAKTTLSNNQRGNDEGTLLQSINYQVIRPGDVTVQVQAYHAQFIEFGTKGNYRPIPGVDASQFRGTPKKTGQGFYDVILRWVKRKKIAGTYNVQTRRRTGSKVDQQIEEEQLAFAIYLSIIRHGIKPSPFFFQHEKPVQKEFEKNVTNAINRLRID